MYDPIADFARVLEALDETEIRKRAPVFADDYRCIWYPGDGSAPVVTDKNGNRIHEDKEK